MDSGGRGSAQDFISEEATPPTRRWEGARLTFGGARVAPSGAEPLPPLSARVKSGLKKSLVAGEKSVDLGRVLKRFDGFKNGGKTRVSDRKIFHKLL